MKVDSVYHTFHQTTFLHTTEIIQTYRAYFLL